MKKIIFALLLLGTTTFAQAPTPSNPTIIVPSNISADSIIRLKIDGTKFDDVGWDILCISNLERIVDHQKMPDGCIFAGPPGKYRVHASGTSDKKITDLLTIITIPGAIPEPTPSIINIKPKFWAVGVFDSHTLFTSLPDSQKAIYVSDTLYDEATKLGGHWRRYDTNSIDITTTAWGKAAIKVGFPALVIVNEDGSVFPYKMPLDEVSIINLLKNSLSK